MLKQKQPAQSGVSMIEVLVTAVIVSFGLLGMAGFQIKAKLAERQVYERAQAIGLLSDMSERMRMNYQTAPNYVSAEIIGTGDVQPAECNNLPIGAIRDTCEWSNALKGAAETKGAKVAGGLPGARGCITQVQAINPATGICQPGIYQVTVAWLGAQPTITPALSCAAGKYGANDAFRRAVSLQVVIPTPACL